MSWSRLSDHVTASNPARSPLGNLELDLGRAYEGLEGQHLPFREGAQVVLLAASFGLESQLGEVQNR